MTGALQSRAVAFLAAAEGTEQSELISPWQTVLAEGGRPVLVSPAADEIQLFEHLDRGKRMPVDMPVGQAREADFDGLVLPGGVANPDQLRTDADAVSFVRSFFTVGKPVAAICHAPWTLIEADVVLGRTHAIPDGEFGAAACSFGLSDIDDLDTAITAISAALRPRGCLVFSILHPCFPGGKDIAGSWPATASYYEEGHWTAQETDPHCGARSGPIIGRCPPTSIRSTATACGSTASRSRCQNPAGIRLTTPTASPCISLPG